jgi:hypothetical protein
VFCHCSADNRQIREDGNAVGAVEQSAALSVSYQLVLDGVPGTMTCTPPVPAVPVVLPLPDDAPDPDAPGPPSLAAPEVQATFAAPPSKSASAQATPEGRPPRKRAGLDLMCISSTSKIVSP